MKSDGNRASSSAIANYLEKEDIQSEEQALKEGRLPEKRSGFFNHDRDGISKGSVIESIDNNKKKLSQRDSKFYCVTISPSEKEQKHLLKSIAKNKNVSTVRDLNKEEKKRFDEKLKTLSRKAMDEYAKNFKRNGLKNGSQLLYYGKVEHQRTYKGTDQEVKDGKVKSGALKPGLQSHVHIIVSRKDKEQKMKLSPLATEKAGKANSQLKGKRVQRGFDRKAFKNAVERVFDKQFRYKRQEHEKVNQQIKNSKVMKTQQEKSKDQNNATNKESSVGKLQDFVKKSQEDRMTSLSKEWEKLKTEKERETFIQKKGKAAKELLDKKQHNDKQVHNDKRLGLKERMDQHVQQVKQREKESQKAKGSEYEL